LEEKRNALEDPAVVRDGRLVQDAYAAIEEAQKAVDGLYARWAELEEKMG
jgi:ABC transport system ATP-binding/permease protein